MPEQLTQKEIEHQNIFNQIILDQYRETFGKDPEPYALESRTDDAPPPPPPPPPSSFNTTWWDLGFGATQGLLVGVENGYRGIAGSHIANGASQAQMSSFFSGLATKYQNAITAGGGVPSAGEAAAINNFNRAASYASASQASAATGASFSNVANSMSKAGGVIGGLGTAFAFASGAATGGVPGVGSAGASLAGSLLAGTVVTAMFAELAATALVGLGVSAGVAAGVVGVGVIGAAFLGGLGGQYLYDSGYTRAMGIDFLMEKAMENGVGRFIDLLRETGEWWGSAIYDWLHPNESVQNNYDQARNWMRRFDPIALDLDGDGIEVVSPDEGIYFDHNNDGIATGTGWVSSDDGLLVIDKNGNGLIDGGSELFGDGNQDSIRDANDPADLSAGIIALRKYDTNNDGKFDVNDSSFSTVKVWRDLNQDGLSQPDELYSLGEAGVQSINLVPTSTSDINVGSGNVADSTGQFTRSDGSSGEFYDLLLASSPFRREFKDEISLTEKAMSIADMQGSGMVRDLREAASIDESLADAIAALDSGVSKDQMLQQMDTILLKWANTSTMRDTQALVTEFGGINGSFRVSKSGGTTIDLTQIVSVLERFNGTNFFRQNSDGKLRVGNVDYVPSSVTVDGAATNSFDINLEPGSADLLIQSYEALKSSVYGALVLQTRLRDYMQDLDLKVGPAGGYIDTSEALIRLQDKYAVNQESALEDAADLLRYAGDFLAEAKLFLLAQVEAWVIDLSSTNEGKTVLQAAGFNLADGNLTLIASGGLVSGGAGNDNIGGQNGSDIVLSGAGDDYIYTRGGSDTISAGEGNDSVYAGDGNDLVSGGGGNDTLNGENGNDILLGGSGDDRVNGGDGHDILRGGDGNDVLQGNAGNDRLQGGIGNDTLNGGTGSNTYMFGRGDGHDTVTVSHDANTGKQNVLVLGEAITTADISLKRVYDASLGGDGALQITIQNPNGEADTITFNGFLYGDDPANSYNGLQFIQFADGTMWTLDDITTELFSVVDGSIRGTVGNDVLHGTEADNKLQGLAGNDTLHGEDGNDELYGGVGDDTLLGGIGDDSLDGSAGNDLLVGGSGNDRLNGGTGDNIYQFGLGDGADVIASVFDDTVGKSSTLQFKAGISVSDVTVSQVAGNWGSQDLLLVVGSSGDQVLVKGFFDQDNPGGVNNPLQNVSFADGTVWTVADLLARTYAGTDANENLIGTVANDSIHGGAGSDQLYGRAGNDTLNGDDGDDSLYGEAGDDVLLGGAGSDMLSGGEGNDTLDGSTGNDRLTGGRGNNHYLFGIGDGQDVIISEFDDTAGKTNTLVFKAGIGVNDIVLRQIHGAFASSDLEVSIAGASDKIILQQFIFNDTLGHAANPVQNFEFADGTIWTLDQIRARLFAGTTADDVLRGTSAADVIGGAAGSDRISGGAGADTINGGDSDDWLDGQQDNDTLSGGAGDDYLHGCDGDDILDGGMGNDRLVGNAGQNTFRFGRGDGQDLILDNSDQGLGSVNTLELKAGIVPGDITLLQVSENSGGPRTSLRVGIAGTNDYITIQNYFKDHDPSNILNPVQQVRFADGTVWNIQQVVSRLFAGTPGDDSVEGTVADDTISGGEGNDTLLGMGGSDTLNGGMGNDVLDGDEGADQMHGGQGDDLYRVNNAGDVVTETIGEGHDTIESDVSYILPANVESLRLIGSANVNATGGGFDDKLNGNAGSNALTGLAGNDLLDGGAGVDAMVGGLGDDTYVVDNAADVITEMSGEGYDKVVASSSYALSSDVEELELAEAASNAQAMGNALDNKLIGNASDNRLDGGAGADQMIGGAGNDTYVVDSALDQIIEMQGEGWDEVESNISYTLGDTLESLVLTGTSNLDATGNDGNNKLIGNSGNNILNGLAGSDSMSGGAGDDFYVVDQSGDDVSEDEGEGTDTIERHYETNYILESNVENLILGAGATTGHGNQLDNHIIGNAGNNSSLGQAGNDRIEGLAGNDQLFGDAGDDTLLGGTGDDYLEGGDGVDRLEGGDAADQLGGGTGLDTLIGGQGDDRYVLTLDGQTDIIDNSGGGFDGIFFGSTVSKQQLSFKREGDDLLIIVDDNAAAPAARVVNHFLGGDWAIDFVQPSTSGSYYLTTAEINAKVAAYGTGYDTVMDGTELADQGSGALVGTAGKDWIRVLGGDDHAFGNAGDDLLQGGAGNDYLAGGLGNDTNTGNDRLEGGDGNDTLAGQDGDDTLIGGAGNDTYMWGGGFDVIDNAGGGTDYLILPSDIPTSRLSFSKDGNDLIIKIDNDATRGARVVGHFLGGDAALDYVGPNNGTMIGTAQMNQLATGGTPGFDQTIEGTANGEQLTGGAGKDMIRGLAGNDTAFGMAGDDTLQGGDGDDYLAGGSGSGTGSGNDRLEGGIGNDALAGEDGNDTLIGGAGDDQYTYKSGQDIIDNTGGGNDGLFFQDGITESQLGFARTGDDLLITVNGNTSNSVRVSNHFLGGDYALDYLQPATGNMLTTAQINAKVGGTTTPPSTGGSGAPSQGNDADYPSKKNGTTAGEQIVGTSGRDLIKGLAGNDTLFGMSGDDKLVGDDGNDYLSGGNGSYSGSGHDILIGGNGNDTLVGEDGNDTMFGGVGDDKYVFGGGSDVVDNSGGGTDWVLFNSSNKSVDRTRLGFHRDGDDLIIRVDGDPNQQVRIYKHFDASGAYAIDYIQPSDGYGIAASSIPALLTPMPSSQTSSQSMFANAYSDFQPVSYEERSLSTVSTNSGGIGRGNAKRNRIAARLNSLGEEFQSVPTGDAPILWEHGFKPVVSPGSPIGHDELLSELLGFETLFGMEESPVVMNDYGSIYSRGGEHLMAGPLGLENVGLSPRFIVHSEQWSELQLMIDAMASYGQAGQDVISSIEPNTKVQEMLDRQFYSNSTRVSAVPSAML